MDPTLTSTGESSIVFYNRERFYQSNSVNCLISTSRDGEIDDIEVEGMWAEEGDDGGMDDDIAAAYEQFLKLTPNKTNGRARR